MSLTISSILAITKDSILPMELIEKNMINPHDLTIAQLQQVLDSTSTLTILQEYANTNDKITIDYVSKYYTYFCNIYNSYSSLPEGAQLAFQTVNFSDVDSFIGKAYSLSSCSQDYFDL